MRFSNQYKIWEMGDEFLVIDDHTGNTSLSDVYKLNKTSVFLWRSLENKAFEAADLEALLCEHYGIDAATAATDVEEFVEQMKGYGFIVD